MPFAMSAAQTPRVIEEALLRGLRRRPGNARAQTPPNFSHNNYLAELSGVAQRAKPEAHVEGGGRNTYKRRRMQEDSGHSGYSNSSFEENGGGLAASRDNNYLTEARAPNWGRNAPGAGAPRGNCNAWLKGFTRESMALLRLRERQRISAAANAGAAPGDRAGRAALRSTQRDASLRSEHPVARVA